MFVFLPHWSRVVCRFFVLLSLVPLDRSVGFVQFFIVHLRVLVVYLNNVAVLLGSNNIYMLVCTLWFFVLVFIHIRVEFWIQCVRIYLG
ncbi:hypothetical protein Hanom_Chr16g01484441 [Helianthus anomalus]